MSAAVLDADEDGWPDIFVTNDTLPNFLFRNRGDGSFEEVAVQFGVAFNDQGTAFQAWARMRRTTTTTDIRT